MAPVASRTVALACRKQKGVQTVQVGDIRVDVLFSPHPKRDRNHGLNLLASS
jgi:hypothetical protein